MPFLPWIDDKKLLHAFAELSEAVNRGMEKSKKDKNRNVIDPFSTIFTLSFFNMSHDHWLTMEEFRQSEKSLSNALGTFHQRILGGVNGWQDLGANEVIDIVNNDGKIIAEVKNKYNTVKGSDRINIYNTLHQCIHDKRSVYRGYKAYFVTIIPKKAAGIHCPFAPSDSKVSKKPLEDDSIMEIDGKRFYELATGCPTALEDLFKLIPDILSTKHSHTMIDDKSKIYLKNLFYRVFAK